MSVKNYCEDCEASSYFHLYTWINALMEFLLRPLRSLPFSFKVGNTFETQLQRVLILFGVAEVAERFDLLQLQPRSAFFIEAARKRGIGCKVLKLFGKESEHLLLEHSGKTYRFYGPVAAAEFDGISSAIMDDKWSTKKFLEKEFPVAHGKTYFWWQKKRALREAEGLGYPVVVKPRFGTFGRHITTNVRDAESLNTAIDHALRYEPCFMIERYVAGAVYRITVVDFESVFAVRRTAPRVVGDGNSSVRQLIEGKNATPARDRARHRFPALRAIAENKETDEMLREQHATFAWVPARSEELFLRRDPHRRLGGDVIDETAAMHPENRKLAVAIAKKFGVHLVGLDIILQDISKPWRQQSAAVLEANSLPSLEMHHVVSEGRARDIAGTCVDLFFKYYVQEF